MSTRSSKTAEIAVAADASYPVTPVSSTGEQSTLQRRIIYDSRLTLIVTSYSEFETQVVDLVEANQGFIAKSESTRKYADRQSGTWVVRIPVEHYTSFLSQVVQTGFAESRVENAQDITAEYVDVETRIRNNQQLEKRVLAILEERTGKLSDVLEIERELSRVRDEIERMQGQLRVLTDQSSLATITIIVREVKDYFPEAAPTLGARITTAWDQSIAQLLKASEAVLISFVVLIPWMLPPITLIIIVYLARRRRHAKPKQP